MSAAERRSLGSVEQACSRKVRFLDRRVAKREAKRLRKVRGAGFTLIPYFCDFCGCWHIGNRWEDS